MNTSQQSPALFLDRDGVLNRRLPQAYVTTPQQFQVLPGVLEALRLLAPIYHPILMVTNQQGIGKGLMSEEDLQAIHTQFLQQVQEAGGRMDHIYHCSALKSDHSFMRKPAIGMALQARRDYPAIRLKHSVMVGDTCSDMLFGRRAGMTTVLVGDDTALPRQYPTLVDYYYPTLLDFATQHPHI